MSSSVLALHHGYRVAGGEERAATQLAELAEAQLGERVAWLYRDSTALTATAAARGMLAGGFGARQVASALEQTGADLLHAHNLFPTFGPAALRSARRAGAAVVVHLHNTRLLCSVATNVRRGEDCTRCHGHWTAPGVVHRCRGSVPEAVVYGAALPRWRREIVRLADAVIVPSVAARSRMLQLGLGLPADAMYVVGGVAPQIARHSTASSGRFALLVSRLAPEKDVPTAIEACAQAGVPLVIAGDGPERRRLQAYAGRERRPERARQAATDILGEQLLTVLPTVEVRGTTIFTGQVDTSTLAALRATACVALSPSLAYETFGLSALESMAAALPTIGSRVGALPELLGDDATVPPRDVAALAQRIGELAGDNAAGMRAAARAHAHANPQLVAARLRSAYAAAREQRFVRRAYRR
ncbi:MAG: glycosyltransferase family 4 protein [Patulibacter sp.]